MTDMTERLEIKASTAAASDSDSMFAEFMTAFEEFKRTNDGRLKELEKRGATDALTEEKLGRLNQALDGAKAAMDRLSLEKARPALEAGRPDLGDEYKDAFSAYVKRGEEKALSIGSNPDGGYLVPSETESEIMKRLTAVSPRRRCWGSSWWRPRTCRTWRPRRRRLRSGISGAGIWWWIALG